MKAHLDQLYDWMDHWIFRPYIYITAHPIFIFLLIILGIGLVGAFGIFGTTVGELRFGNFTNVVSAVGAVILLYRQQYNHKEVKKLHAVNHQTMMKHGRLIRSHLSSTRNEVDSLKKEIDSLKTRGKNG